MIHIALGTGVGRFDEHEDIWLLPFLWSKPRNDAMENPTSFTARSSELIL